jgi:hypothetical protein
MNIKRCICYVLLAAAMLGCKKDPQLMYSTGDNIYLNYKDQNGQQDTTALTYSFAYQPTLTKDTIWLPVIISGARVNHERSFTLEVVNKAIDSDSAATAIAGTHYEPLKPSYTLPADSGKVLVPVIIKNTDPKLAERSVYLNIRVSGGKDFNSDLPDKLRSKLIIFSARLEKPDWWMFWQGQLGEYSRIKHQLFLISSGTRDLVNLSKPDAYLQIPRALYSIDNVRIFTGDPFTWVKRYPEKGYVITKRTDGTADYDFYSSSSPEKKFYLKYYAVVNRYFFIDELGGQIIIN